MPEIMLSQFNPESKKHLLELCRQSLFSSAEAIHLAWNEISESMRTETKSSVGDKHETARARMQFEQEKLGRQIQELETQQADLERVDLSKPHTQIGFGSLVTTSRGSFFVCVPLGKLLFNGEPVYVVSPSSPLAVAMKGLKKGQAFVLNSVQHSILFVA